MSAIRPYRFMEGMDIPKNTLWNNSSETAELHPFTRGPTEYKPWIFWGESWG